MAVSKYRAVRTSLRLACYAAVTIVFTNNIHEHRLSDAALHACDTEGISQCVEGVGTTLASVARRPEPSR